MTGFAEFIGGMRGDPGDRPDALARAMHAPEPRGPEPRDADEIAANLMGRGYAPGQASDLAQRYGDALAELAAVREANEAARKRQERIARDHAAGRITAFDIMRMDTSEPDTAREQHLERRAESLARQLGDAQAMITSPQVRLDGDGLEASASRARAAHQAFIDVTRQRMAELTAAAPARHPERRPFASRSGQAVRSEVTCEHCIKYGATPAESFLIHQDPSPGPAPALPSEHELDYMSGRQADAERVESWPRRFDASGREMAVR